MADIKKPKKKIDRVPPSFEQPTPNNLKKQASDELVNLNLSVTAGFRKEYKGYAFDNDISMAELLKRSFEFYKKHNL